MGGKKNKRNRRKPKQIKESERAEGPTRFDEGPSVAAAGPTSLDEGLSQAAGPSEPAGRGSTEPPRRDAESWKAEYYCMPQGGAPSEPAGRGSTEPPRRDAESWKAEYYGMPQGGVQSFDYLYGSRDESQNIISETLQLLKNKDAEINELSEMLNSAMHNWLKDMLKKVEMVKTEIASTRDLVLPTCAVLDKLKSRRSEAEDIGKLVHSILDKVENMVKQLPAATAVISVVMEQMDLLPKDEFTMTSSRQYVEVSEESLINVEPHPLENTSLASVSDPESYKLHEHALQKSIVAVPSDYEQMVEVTEARHAEGSDRDPDISEEMFTVLKTKDAEIKGFKDLLTNLMKYRVKDLMRKMDLATAEAEVTRNLAIYATDVMESLKRSPVEVDELKYLVDVLFRKVDFIMYQISAATRIVDCTVEHISRLERTEDFRNEIYKLSIYDSDAFLYSGNEAQPEADYLANKTRSDLETGMGELHIEHSTRRSRTRKTSGLDRSKRGDKADEYYLPGDQMRGNSSVSSDDVEEDSYLLEVSALLELMSPENILKKEYSECSMDQGVMSQTCSGHFDVQDCFQDKGEFFETVDDFVLEFKCNVLEHDTDHLGYSEEYNQLEYKKLDVQKCEGECESKYLTTDPEAECEHSSDEDSSPEETGSEGIWLFKLDRQG